MQLIKKYELCRRHIHALAEAERQCLASLSSEQRWNRWNASKSCFFFLQIFFSCFFHGNLALFCWMGIIIKAWHGDGNGSQPLNWPLLCSLCRATSWVKIVRVPKQIKRRKKKTCASFIKVILQPWGPSDETCWVRGVEQPSVTTGGSSSGG